MAVPCRALLGVGRSQDVADVVGDVVPVVEGRLVAEGRVHSLVVGGKVLAAAGGMVTHLHLVRLLGMVVVILIFRAPPF